MMTSRSNDSAFIADTRNSGKVDYPTRAPKGSHEFPHVSLYRHHEVRHRTDCGRDEIVAQTDRGLEFQQQHF